MQEDTVSTASRQAFRRGCTCHGQLEGCWKRWNQPRQASMSGSGWETQSVSETEECGRDEAWQFAQCQVSSRPQREQGAWMAGHALLARQVWDASHPTFSPLLSLCAYHWVQAPRPSVSFLGSICGCLNLCQARHTRAGARFYSFSENSFLSNPSSCPLPIRARSELCTALL